MRYKSVFKRFIFIFSLVCLTAISVKAQYDPSYSHYWAMEPSFNPATVGKDNKLMLWVHTRSTSLVMNTTQTLST